MFECFTDRARKVMALANQEAQRFNHEYIGTEHILLGLVKEGSGVGATVLKNLDVDIKKLRLEVKKMVKSSPDMVTMGKLPQTPRAKKVIEYALEEARSLNQNYVGTEHILLGLLRENKSTATQVLMNLGLKLEDVRQKILNLLQICTNLIFKLKDVRKEVLKLLQACTNLGLKLEDVRQEVLNRLIEAQKRDLNKLLTKWLTKELTSADRLIIYLYHNKKMTFKEIAAKTGLSEARVAQRYSSIITRLKAQMNSPKKDGAEKKKQRPRTQHYLFANETMRDLEPTLEAFYEAVCNLLMNPQKKGEIKMSKKSRRSKNIISADEGLLENEVVKKFLKKYLKDPEIDYICSLRDSLYNKKIHGLTEAFNKKSRYFSYWTGTDEDRVYIYIQKKDLRIDLLISRDFEEEILQEDEDFEVRHVNNYQGKAGWLTGWYVPYSTKNIKVVIKYISKAFEGIFD